MGDPTRRSRSRSRAHHAARPAAFPSPARGLARATYLLSIFILITGLFLPMVSATTTAAAPQPGATSLDAGSHQARDGAPPPFPVPGQVIAAGDFQDELGCAQDWDTGCNASELQPQGDNIWASVLPIPPGSYQLRIVTVGDETRSLGENSDPEGGDLDLDVPDGAIGAYVSYNHNNGRIVAQAVFNDIQLTTDFGTVPMTPAADGNFEAFIDVQPGASFSAQVLVDGNPVTDPVQIEAGNTDRMRIVADSGGNLVESSDVATAVLIVYKTDEAGNFLPGACFTVYGRRDTVAGQACDEDDGEDGITVINFPTGVPGGNLELAETLTPDGQDTAPEQGIDIGPGQNEVQVFAAGGEVPTEEVPTEEVPTEEVPTEEVPTEEPGPTTVEIGIVSADEAGNPLPFACYAVDGVGEVCDDDGDGIVTFQLEPNVTYTITETRAPEGYEGFGSSDITVPEGGGSFQITHSPSEVSAQTGTLILYKVDEDGNLLPGSCYNIRPRSGTEGEEFNLCDGEEGDNDGVINAGELAEGRWRIEETQAPEGYQPRRPFNVDIVANQTTEETVENTQAAPETGTLIAFTADEDGNPIGGVCYTVTGTQTDLGEQCDEDGDGDMGLVDIPADTYTVQQASVPEGFELDPDAEQIEVPAGGEQQVTFTSPSTGPGTGSLVILKTDENGNPLGGACFVVTDSDGNTADQVCDEEGDGELRFDDVPAGSYTVEEMIAPDGYQAAGAQPVDVPEGGEGVVTFVNQPVEPETGALIVNVTDADGFSIVGACVRVSGPATAEACDNGEGDSDPEEGIIRIEDLPEGDYQVETTSVPEGFEPAAPGTASVVAGEDQIASIASQPVEPTAAPTGSVLIRKVDPDGGRLEGSCFLLEGPQTYGPICDQQEGDNDDATGRIRINDVEPGDYTVTEATAPVGFNPADPQTITVASGETTRVTFENRPAAGTITVATVGENGNAVGGACYTLDGGNETCDDGSGVVAFGDVAPGAHTVEQTSPPAGYSQSEPAAQEVEVQGGADSPLTFTVVQQPGAIEITKLDDAGNPLGGACFSVDGGDQVCDEDGDGVTLIENVVPGDHTVAETQAPEGFEGAGEQSVTVAAGETAPVSFTNNRLLGAIQITKTDEGGNPLGGACFAVDGGTEVCDNGEGDADGGEGAVRIENVPAGPHTVAETQAPNGYAGAEDQAVDVPAGDAAPVTFVNSQLPGSIQITKTDEGGNALGGACFAVDDGEPVCDEDGDGIVVIENVSAGEHTVAETQAPEGYEGGGSEQVTVEAGEQAEVQFTDTRLPGAITVTTIDAEGNPLPGACYAVDGGEPVCDEDGDGVVEITGLAEGETTVAQTTAPEGFQPAGEEPVSVAAGQTEEITVQNEAVPTETPTETPTESPTEQPTEEPTVAPTEEATQAPTEEATATPTEEATAAATEEPTEAGTLEPTDTPTETPTEEPPPATGGLLIIKQDGAGGALGGACFTLSGPSEVGPVCDNDPSDTDPADGLIRIEGVIEGDYTLTETDAPEGFSLAAPQPVSITGNETAEITLVNEAEPATLGNVRIVSLGEENRPAGGGCYRIGATEVCDNGGGDSDPAPGVVLVEGVITGEYEVTETTAPEGYQGAGPLPVTVEPDSAVAEITFTHELAPVETGGLRIRLRDQDGNPAPGGCVILTRYLETTDAEGIVTSVPEETRYCDGGPEDEDPAEAELLLRNIPVDTYSIAPVDTPEGEAAVRFARIGSAAPGPAGSLRAAAASNLNFSAEKTVTVQVNIIIIVIIIIIVEPPQEGDLQIVKRAADTNQLQPDACFKVTGPGGEIELCDNDGFDASGTVGVIRFTDLAFGEYDVEETQAPPGYEPAADTTVTISSSGLKTLLIKNEPIEDTTGGLIVHKIDENGNPLPGACFALRAGNTVVAGPVCDDAGGSPNDGTITFEDVEKGNYTLRETQAPSADYDPAPDQPVTIVAGVDDKEIDVVNTIKPGWVLITKTAEDGSTLLEGACFGLDRGSGVEYEICDQQPGDGDLEVGIIFFAEVPAGNWALVETQAPAGYDPAPNEDITVPPGDGVNLIIENTETPPAPDVGTVVVEKVDENGGALAGACFALRQGNVTKASRCDNADGANDGTITLGNVPVGDYVLRETKRPSLQYKQAPDRNVTVTKDQTTTVEVENELQPGRLVIRKINQQGQVLQNACFTITPDPNSAGQKCTGPSGEVVFDNLPTNQVYKVTETKAPSGYEKTAPKTNITIKPGLTTKVTIVDKKKKPAPTDGSILVIKFFCPAGKGGTTTQVLDTSDPGPDQLAKTANCKKGNANFTIARKNGQGDPIDFSTGADGEYQTTLTEGVYILTEKGTGAKEELTVYINQQTTIVVLNFVKPPEPKPATIKVIKYSCEAGFEAVYYADFVANCGDPSSLTNGVVFKVTGAVNQNRTTGSGGQKGATTFTNLPAGSYTLRETPPSGSSTVYGFCGYDQNNPDWKVVGDKINLTLGAGDTIVCTWFNVPDDLTDSTGAILIHKYICDIQGKIPANYDWFENCTPYVDGTKFALSVKQGSKFVPSKTGITNDDGLLRFSRLKPGTYQLKEVGADWCYAESDNVDAQGNVLVRAGQRSNVWIFNCTTTRQPPNTGAGTTAGLERSAAFGGLDAGSVDGGMMLFGLTWPLVGLAVFGLRRRRAYAYRRAA